MSGVVVYNPSGVEENPRRKKRRSKTRRKSTSTRKASARRNPGNQPRRRRARRRTYRNPALRLPKFGGLDFGQVGLGVVGAIGTDLGGEYLSRMLPAQFQGGAAKYAVKGGLVLLGSMLLGKVIGRQAGVAMATGGAIMLGAEAVHEFVLPAVTGGAAAVSGYMQDPSVAGYMPDTSMSGWSPGWAQSADY